MKGLETVLDWVKLGGGIAGFASLIWKFSEVYGAYLFLEVSSNNDRATGLVRVKTILENKSLKGKTLGAAFLLISLASELPEEAVKALQRTKLLPKFKFENDNQMVYQLYQAIRRCDKLARRGVVDNAGHAFIPLTYYFWENSSVGDERLSYEVLIDADCLLVSFSVRFYVQPKGLLHTLHRVVQSGFDTFDVAQEQ